MTDFYPLIRRAVSTLERNTLEERHAIYERARNTLAQILRSSAPLPTETEIVGECLALDKAIARVEAPYSCLESLAHLPPQARAALQSTLDAMRRLDRPTAPFPGNIPKRRSRR
jgi:hypothetical protein